MASTAAAAALLINSHRANYRRKPNVRREGCTSGESETYRMVGIEETAVLAEEYTRWRSDRYWVMASAFSEQNMCHVALKPQLKTNSRPVQ